MPKDKRELLAGYIDGELSDKERQELELELEKNPELKAELKEFKKLKEVTGMVRYADLPDEVWENYWQSLYRKLERGLGWIFLSIGAIILICLGLYQFFKQLYIDLQTPLIVKISITAVCIGVAILLVSFGRERIFAYKRDRYREVKK